MLSVSDVLLSVPVLVLWLGPAVVGAVWAGIAGGRRVASYARSFRNSAAIIEA